MLEINEEEIIMILQLIDGQMNYKLLLQCTG